MFYRPNLNIFWHIAKVCFAKRNCAYKQAHSWLVCFCGQDTEGFLEIIAWRKYSARNYVTGLMYSKQ